MAWCGLRALADGVLAVPGRAPIEIPDMAGAFDYVGFSYYCAQSIYVDGTGPYPADARVGPMGYAPWAEGLGIVLRRLADELPGRALLVDECGVGTDDDAWRVEVLRDSLIEVERAVADGVDVRGFFHWTGVDNYEWDFGYDVQFGLFDRDRNPKPSAAAGPSLGDGIDGGTSGERRPTTPTSRRPPRRRPGARPRATWPTACGWVSGPARPSTSRSWRWVSANPTSCARPRRAAPTTWPRSLGLRVVAPDEIGHLDITIDGADEVDPDFNLTKGAGGAHTREKIVAEMSDRFIVVVDESKLVDHLGAVRHAARGARLRPRRRGRVGARRSARPRSRPAPTAATTATCSSTRSSA